MPALPPSGSLAETPLPRLLLDLHAARYAGGLELRRGRVEKRFQLRDGEPVVAESNLASEALTRCLIQQGTLPPEAGEQVQRYAAARSCKEEAALLALQLLPPKALVLAIREQIRRRLLECFAWSEGEFRLDPKAVPAPENAAFRVDAVALVRDGLLAHWSPDRLLRELSEPLARYPQRTPHFEAIARRLAGVAEGDALLDALEETSVAAAALPQGSSVALATLWVLAASGALRFGETALAEAEKDAAPPIPAAAEAALEIVIRGREQQAARPEAARGGSKRGGAKQARQAAELREEVLAKHARLGEIDHYAALGLERSASAAGVKRAYLLAAKRFHPDVLSRLGLDDLKAQANEVFAEIVRANDVLSNPERRAEYDASASGESALDANRVAQAETLYRKGEILLRAGNFAAAIAFLASAVDLWPEDPAYQATLGWALFRKSSPDLERAAAHLEKAVALAPGERETVRRLEAVRRELGKR